MTSRYEHEAWARLGPGLSRIFQNEGQRRQELFTFKAQMALREKENAAEEDRWKQDFKLKQDAIAEEQDRYNEILEKEEIKQAGIDEALSAILGATTTGQIDPMAQTNPRAALEYAPEDIKGASDRLSRMGQMGGGNLQVLASLAGGALEAGGAIGAKPEVAQPTKVDLKPGYSSFDLMSLTAPSLSTEAKRALVEMNLDKFVPPDPKDRAIKDQQYLSNIGISNRYSLMVPLLQSGEEITPEKMKSMSDAGWKVYKEMVDSGEINNTAANVAAFSAALTQGDMQARSEVLGLEMGEKQLSSYGRGGGGGGAGPTAKDKALSDLIFKVQFNQPITPEDAAAAGIEDLEGFIAGVKEDPFYGKEPLPPGTTEDETPTDWNQFLSDFKSEYDPELIGEKMGLTGGSPGTILKMLRGGEEDYLAATERGVPVEIRKEMWDMLNTLLNRYENLTGERPWTSF